ncbi:hypothetical protein [Fictibacillus arsenicus]|uniref:Uncharacterized protein n=1 Tax=Fictibacillus arsenicus TaxID=255247 RepID=A0A1V3GAZ3_9BACL|nr:hypothetical protein [Fictibacillus arsenicus]OOE14034.1 hypothetical protein UN64_02135 [Fictibacillus arsenicus]
MKHTTKKILEVFPDLEQHLLGKKNMNEEVLSAMDPVKRTFLQLGSFFENPKQEHFDLALLYQHLDGDWLELALELITRYFREETYLIQKPSYSLIKDGSDYLNQTEFARYLTDQGVPYDRQKLNLYYERGKVPKADLFLGSGKKYWHLSTVQAFCEQEKNRMIHKFEREC